MSDNFRDISVTYQDVDRSNPREIRNIQRCGKCHKQVYANDDYCRKCGCRLAHTEVHLQHLLRARGVTKHNAGKIYYGKPCQSVVDLEKVDVILPERKVTGYKSKIEVYQARGGVLMTTQSYDVDEGNEVLVSLREEYPAHSWSTHLVGGRFIFIGKEFD